MRLPIPKIFQMIQPQPKKLLTHTKILKNLLKEKKMKF